MHCGMEYIFSKKTNSSGKSYKENRIHVLLVESFVLRNRESTCTCLAGCHNDYEMFRHRVNTHCRMVFLARSCTIRQA
jgi:hypothetical protein